MNGAPKNLTVFLPGPFTGVAQDLATAYRAARQPNVSVQLAPFLPAGDLVQRVRAGDAPDLIVADSVDYLLELKEEGRVDSAWAIAGGRLVALVRPALPLRMVVGPGTTLAQAEALAARMPTAATVDPARLAQQQLRVVLPDPERDPCGEYVVGMLERAGALEEARAKVRDGIWVFSRGTMELPGYLVRGEADVGLVYQSVARDLAGQGLEVLRLAPGFSMEDEIVFAAATVRSTSQASDLAGDFMEFLLSEEGQSILLRAGFLPPPRWAM